MRRASENAVSAVFGREEPADARELLVRAVGVAGADGNRAWCSSSSAPMGRTAVRCVVRSFISPRCRLSDVPPVRVGERPLFRAARSVMASFLRGTWVWMKEGGAGVKYAGG
ncbi:hypothetical protein MRX96_028154 [Rhipicephalus microplus]